MAPARHPTSSPLLHTICGDCLYALRTEALLSQMDLAKKAGLEASTVSNKERGLHRSRPRVVRALAAALGVEPADIAHESGQCPRRDVREPKLA